MKTQEVRMKRDPNQLVRMAREAQRLLTELMAELGADGRDENWLLSKDVHAGSGFDVLDELLGGGALPKGLVVEMIGVDDRALLWLASHWAASAQGAAGFAAVLDPFDELRNLPDACALDMVRTLLVDVKDPHDLARSAVALLQRGALDALVLPPGLLEHGHLMDRPKCRIRGMRDEARAFARALEAICWLGRRRHATVLILRKRAAGKPLDPLGLAHVRLELSIHGRMLSVRIAQNVLRPEACGRDIQLLFPDIDMKAFRKREGMRGVADHVPRINARHL
jgi:hypothetical protein